MESGSARREVMTAGSTGYRFGIIVFKLNACGHEVVSIRRTRVCPKGEVIPRRNSCKVSSTSGNGVVVGVPGTVIGSEPSDKEAGEIGVPRTS